MLTDEIFTIDDTTLYTSWETTEGGIVVVFVPGIGAIKMTPEKAEEIGKDLIRKAEYVRWHTIENKHNEKVKLEQL